MSYQYYGASLPVLAENNVIQYSPCDVNGYPIVALKTPAAGSETPVKAAVKSVPTTPGGALNDILFTTNAEGFTAGSIQLTGTFVATVVIEGSNDTTNGTDGNWLNIILTRPTAAGTANDPSSLTAVDAANFPVGFKWVRARISAYTSGSVVSSAVLKQGVWPTPRSVFANLGALVAGTATIGGAALVASSSIGTAFTNAKVKAAATINATSVKATAGRLFGYAFYNNTASAKFVKFYAKASAPAPATDTALLLFTVIVPANGQAVWTSPVGKAISTGIAYAITGAIAEADVTATAVDDVVGFIDYV